MKNYYSQMILSKRTAITKVVNKDWFIALCFLFPVIVFITIFAFYPTFFAIYLSFFKSKFLIFNKQFVGLQNYIQILQMQSSTFWFSLFKSFVFTFWSVVFQFVVGLILALTLRKKTQLNKILRSIIILPWILSPVVIAVIFQFFYISDRSGLLNYILLLLGIISEPVAWLGIDRAMEMVIVANVWFGMPFSMVMLLAGLQSINEDVFEASNIDGATGLQQLFYITLPQLKPTIMVTLIWITTSTFNEFELVYALTGGGPLEATSLLGIKMYNTAFKFGHFELGASFAVLMFAINLALSITYFRMLKTEDS